jgi:small subunit ribosomal protein S20
MMKTRVKNAMKAVRTAIESQDQDAVTAALKAATTVLDKAASKKVVHWRTAARMISRLSLAANKI